MNAVVAVAAGLMVVGCSGNKKESATMSAAVTDVTPTSPAASTSSAGFTAAQPVIYDSAPASGSNSSAASTTVINASTSGSTSGGGSYTVKKGDTLYAIAKTHYGDGKQWQKITAANPGLKPSTLKVGQTITLP